MSPICLGKLLFLLHDTEMTIPLFSIAILVSKKETDLGKSKIFPSPNQRSPHAYGFFGM